MNLIQRSATGARVVAAALLLVGAAHSTALAQNEKSAKQDKPVLELYGFVMSDFIFDFGQNHPDWFDVIRPTKLPAFDGEYGDDGRSWFSVRQTRFGTKAFLPTGLGELMTQFEWELFGTGVDAGQTTLRLRHAYGELGHFGAGQYWSPYMDIDVFPNSIEYWGPNGMAFFRNVQVRYMPVKGDSRITIALERPGASADQGRFSDRIELQNVVGRFPLPDLSAEARLGRSWGYVELAGIIRSMKWDDQLLDDGIDLNGSATGWGVSLSSNLKPFKGFVLRMQAVAGEGVQNYMNDAPADVGVVLNPGSVTRPIEGAALGLLGLTGFIDYQWGSRFSTALGYSYLEIDNTDGQTEDAFKTGQYALVNLLYYPTTNVMVGGEVQWGRRDNAFDGFHSDDLRLQFSAKFNFSFRTGTEVASR